MPRDALTPGAYPPKDKIVPIKGRDGVYRLTDVRHRTISGCYTRTSAQGRTIDECLESFERRWKVNRLKGGTVRRNSKRQERVKLQLTDKMSAAFKMFDEMKKVKAEQGKLKWYTYDLYHRTIYANEGARARRDAIKLNVELGSFTISEMGRPSELHGYLLDIADLSPSVAYRHHVILRAVFTELTLQGLFDVSPMRDVPAPDTTVETPQRALSEDERALLPAVLGDEQKRPEGHEYVLPLGLALLGTGIRLGEGLALRWMDIPELDDPTVGCAVAHICGTMTKRVGLPAYRQDARKCVGVPEYWIRLPQWLTTVLRAWKDLCEPAGEEEHLFTIGDRPVDAYRAQYALARLRRGTSLDWLCWGNLRDTAATEVMGRSADRRRASAQLGHSEGSTMATRHYVDRRGFKHPVVDNSEYLEYLNPQNDGNVPNLISRSTRTSLWPA
ncbi:MULTISPECIES: tyrosine-type recombinase/integrase [Nocardia]|uniref:Tyr recombinase domain-containing protein n=2 Tax=Nocardia TaxID=1817 RepID=A0A2T2ZBW7_9NOCA|nr:MULTISPECIES: hypothetical protein [Nocardia]PSR65216.1 hypothetical protein C8259_03370 [Nocardia nova]